MEQNFLRVNVMNFLNTKNSLEQYFIFEMERHPPLSKRVSYCTVLAEVSRQEGSTAHWFAERKGSGQGGRNNSTAAFKWQGTSANSKQLLWRIPLPLEKGQCYSLLLPLGLPHLISAQHITQMSTYRCSWCWGIWNAHSPFWIMT